NVRCATLPPFRFSRSRLLPRPFPERLLRDFLYIGWRHMDKYHDAWTVRPGGGFEAAPIDIVAQIAAGVARARRGDRARACSLYKAGEGKGIAQRVAAGRDRLRRRPKAAGIREERCAIARALLDPHLARPGSDAEHHHNVGILPLEQGR